MVVVQPHEMNNLQDHDYTKVGNGIFLSPYSGGGINEYYRHKKHGDGFFDIVKSGIDFFKNNSSLISNAASAAGGIASAAGGIADVVKTAKEIKRADEELYELKRIKDEMSRRNQEPIFTKAQLEMMDKIRKSGGGIKAV